VGSTYQIEDILARDPLQIWSFGPVLLDENGNTRDHYEVSTAVGYPNPRSGIGYYEPGHYCFVIVDGRNEGHSAGMKIPELAQVFADLGCTAAYNLDGGGTAVMYFNGEKFSVQSNGSRDLGDILLITETGFSLQEGEE
jgi:exopolysaccharide biosynthesis protein